MLKDDLTNAKELVESEKFWSGCEESLGEVGLRDKYSGKVSSILEGMSTDIDCSTDILQRIKRAKLLEYYMLAVKALTMCREVSWISKLLDKRVRLWDIKFGAENVEKNMIAHDLSAALSRKLEKLKYNSKNNTKAEIAWEMAMKARRRIDTAADIISLASLLGYSNIRENEFEEYLDECHGLVKKNGLEYGMIAFFKQNDLAEYVELSLRTLSAIYWSRLNFMAYAYNYINFIEEVPDGDRVYGIMSRVIKEVSKGSAIDDAFNNISGIHALNEFNRLPG